MKIQKVINLCKTQGALYIIETKGEQWVTDGYAAYPMFGLPKFSPETLCETFGLTEEQQSKLILNTKDAKEFDNVDFGDISEEDQPAEILKIGFIIGKRNLLAIKSSSGISFLNRKYLSPFNEDVQIWKRGENFVIASGMLIKGIIIPESGMHATIAAEIKEIAKDL